MDVGEGMPGSVAEEGGVEEGSGNLEKEVSFRVGINGDLTHEEQLKQVLSEADGLGGGKAGELSPGSVFVKMNGGALRADEVSTMQVSTPDGSPPAGLAYASDTAVASTPSRTTKGLGLKRWRRIKRDSNKDGGAVADASRILKRGLSITEPPKAKDDSKQKSQYEGESSVASVESRNLQSASNSVATVRALDQELELLGEIGGFSVGIDSANSDDRSSRFSTAASAPKAKHEGLGYGKDKNRPRNSGGKVSGHAVQPRGQRGKGGAVDITKKLREDLLMFEKENSHSSVESDLRSSTAAFAQWGSITSNGKQSEGSLNFDGESHDEAQVSEEVEAGFCNEAGGDIEDTSRDEPHADMLGKDKMEESKNYLPHQGGDPFVESVILLQAAQDALEKELQKFREIEVETTSLSGYSLAHFSHEETEGSSSVPPESKVIKLCQKVEHLEHELKEASSIVKDKEMRIIELEKILSASKLPQGMRDMGPPQEMFMEMELELESLFRKKIEAEVECLILLSVVQTKRVRLGDPSTLVEQQKSLAEACGETKVKLNVAEDKATLLKRQLEELDVSCKALLGTEEVLRLQNGVCKISLCCFIQAILLFVAFAVLLVQLLPPSGDVVPT